MRDRWIERFRKPIFARPGLRVRSRFNSTKPIVTQVFCIHKWEAKRSWSPNIECFYYQCKKCGKLKDMEWHKT